MQRERAAVVWSPGAAPPLPRRRLTRSACVQRAPRASHHQGQMRPNAGVANKRGWSGRRRAGSHAINLPRTVARAFLFSIVSCRSLTHGAPQDTTWSASPERPLRFPHWQAGALGRGPRREMAVQFGLLARSHYAHAEEERRGWQQERLK